MTVTISIGFKNGLRTIYQYPALLLTPVFSIWTFGPINVKDCCYCSSRIEHRKYLKVSFPLAWGNILLTAISYVASLTLLSNISRYGHSHLHTFFVDGCGYDPPVYTISLLFLIMACISLLIIQFCKSCCCISTCFQNNCFPIVAETVLDPEQPLNLLHWPIINSENEDRKVEESLSLNEINVQLQDNGEEAPDENHTEQLFPLQNETLEPFIANIARNRTYIWSVYTDNGGRIHIIGSPQPSQTDFNNDM